MKTRVTYQKGTPKSHGMTIHRQWFACSADAVHFLQDGKKRYNVKMDHGSFKRG